MQLRRNNFNLEVYTVCRQFKREEILVFLRKCENWGVNFHGF